VAITAVWLQERGGLGQLATAAMIAAICVLNISVIGYRIYHNDYGNRYGRAVAWLQQNTPPDASIVGSGELAFDLGFDGRRLMDDCRLGRTSGRRPDYIVLEAHYSLFWFTWLAAREPETMQYIRKLLREDYEKVYDQTNDSFQSMGTSDLPYQIYKRKAT
jgi:hypothetical protein